MFKPSEVQTLNSKALIEGAFDSVAEYSDRYTIAYGYFNKKGLLGQKILNYVVGFSKEMQELLVAELNPDNGQTGQVFILTPDNVDSVKIGLQKDYKIKTSASPKELRFFVPGYTPKNADNMYMLPIEQIQIAEDFKSFINAIFSL